MAGGALMSAQLRGWLGKAIIVGYVGAAIAFILGFAVYPHFHPSNLAPMSGFFFAPFGFLVGFLVGLLCTAGRLGAARGQGLAVIAAVIALAWTLLMSAWFIPGLVIRGQLLEAEFLPALLKAPLAPAGTLQIWAIGVPAERQQRYSPSLGGPLLELHGHHQFSFPSLEQVRAAYRQPAASTPAADVVASESFAALAELLSAAGMQERFVQAVGPGYSSMGRFAFIDRQGRHVELARRLALDNRECWRPALAETTSADLRAELEQRVMALAAALVGGEPRESLLADSRQRMRLEHGDQHVGQPARIDSLRFCGAWGSPNLVLARVSIAYETPRQLGRSLLSLALRQEEGTWRLLAASDNWQSGTSVDNAALALQRSATRGIGAAEPVLAAEPRAPYQYLAASEASQRSGYLSWSPSPSPAVISEVVEIACRTRYPDGTLHDSVQLSIQPRETGAEPVGHLAASALCSHGWPWKWRLWTLSHDQLLISAEQFLPLPGDRPRCSAEAMPRRSNRACRQ